MSERSHSASEARQGYLTALAVIVVSVGVGLFGLPRLGRHAASDSPLVGRPAADFMLPALTASGLGSTQRLSDLQGKTVLIDFFASWCGPCRQQAPIVARLAHRLAGPNFAVYGVNTSDQYSAAMQYYAEHEASYPVLFDADQEAANAFGVVGLPSLVIIDKKGVVRAFETRVVEERELEALIKDAQGS